MVARFLRATVLAILLGFTAAPCTAQPVPNPRLVLTWVDPYRVVPNTSPLSREVVSIFGSVGVDAEWREYSGRSAPSTTEIEVHVHLRLNQPHRWNLEKSAMGVTFRGPVTSRRVYLFLPAIATALGYHPQELKRWLRERPSTRIARAIARVLVHEAFHAVAPSLPHARVGLTKATLNRTALLAERAYLDSGATDFFRQRLRALTVDLVAGWVEDGSPLDPSSEKRAFVIEETRNPCND